MYFVKVKTHFPFEAFNEQIFLVFHFKELRYAKMLIVISHLIMVLGVASGTNSVFPYQPYSDYELGYINLKKYQGMRLNVTAFHSVNVTTSEECAEECIMVKNPFYKCKGFNIQKTEVSNMTSEQVPCHLLAIDRYRIDPQRFQNDSEWNYFEPSVRK